MRVLTTALDKGEQKIPGEKHKAVLYALAEGEALRTSEPSEVVKITKEMARRAEYTYCLIWREGRVLAEFALDDVLVAQPIKPDPLPRRKRGQKDESVSDASLRGVGRGDLVGTHRNEGPAPRRREHRSLPLFDRRDESVEGADVHHGVAGGPRGAVEAAEAPRSVKRASKRNPPALL